ncbi:hypothetical protein PsAD2_03229 [Pseudovibrio axinellae]|uniref:Uncharacterized protein n=1 Tax=Pseudovibrio axinellae TaxID=989403 RepID=A0A165WY21_9HYPH|nr:hypothetical protein PsAD2_03229 [Pseudovibrio axinellae]SEQ16645.1 hypothetical protein SAMN05421798_10234 [Pseudovibrio axinellae]
MAYPEAKCFWGFAGYGKSAVTNATKLMPGIVRRLLAH